MMKDVVEARVVWVVLLVVVLQTVAAAQAAEQFPEAPKRITGFRDAGAQIEREQKFLRVPDAQRAGQHLETITSTPHLASTPGDRRVVEYIAEQLRSYGFETEIEEYKVWMNMPVEISVSTVSSESRTLIGPSPEQIASDPYQADPRVIQAFNGYSPSGEVEAEVVYANYGRPEDFDKLKEMGIDVRGKIVIARYGQNFRGVKSYVAQERGAAGVILYSDPIDDGYFKGDPYPKGPWRPASSVQRGSILYIFKYPGDPTTPGVASVPTLSEEQRTPPEQAQNLSRVPTTPLSYGDATHVMQGLEGPESPRPWQGALPFTYHVGPGPVRVRLQLKHDYQYRSIWNVVGRIRGSELPDEWVVGGNHHDAWVYGAVDPSSGTAALLEAARGIGELLRSGWRPRRTIVLGTWDAEEQGLIGSTEWAEQHARELGAKAVAYFNIDSAVGGDEFDASAVPSLKEFVREVTKVVPSPKGGSVYRQWRERKEKEKKEKEEQEKKAAPAEVVSARASSRPAAAVQDVPVGDLGSGSDYTPFLQHLGISATDVSSGGPYGVYHSVFDNFAWFKMNADPEFKYLQQMARVYGVQVLRMAEADVLPFDYENYGREAGEYIAAAERKAQQKLGAKAPSFGAARAAAQRFQRAGVEIAKAQRKLPRDAARLNQTLREAERALLLPNGLPRRPWFRHAVYAPGEYTGYAAVVIPGVNEAIDAGDAEGMQQQLAALAEALERAAKVLLSYRY